MVLVTFVEHQRVDRKKEPCEVMKVRSVFSSSFLPSFLWREAHQLPLSLHAVPPELNDRGILNTEPPSLGCFSTFDSFKMSHMDPAGPAPASTVEQLKSAALEEVQCAEGLGLYHFIPDLNFTEPKLVFSWVAKCRPRTWLVIMGTMCLFNIKHLVACC